MKSKTVTNWNGRDSIRICIGNHSMYIYNETAEFTYSLVSCAVLELQA